MEKRIIELELKITHQDDIIDELNTTVFRQQQKIDDLEAMIKELAMRLVSIERMEPINERPPHY